MTVAEHLRAAAQRLAPLSDSPRLDAELLLGHALELSRASLLLRDEQIVGAAAASGFDELVERRAAGEPVAYLLGTQGFWTLDLCVTPEVLIPRPETELIVEWTLALIRGKTAGGDLRMLDLGTGSGAIALALEQERPEATLVATDRSETALAVARRNAQRYGITNLEFRLGDWFDALDSSTRAFDFILSNPPYIAQTDAHLEALAFEPRDALVAGRDGLDDLRRIVRGARPWLKSGGWLMVEHGHDQGSAMHALFEEAGFAQIETRRDYGGRERVTAGCAA